MGFGTCTSGACDSGAGVGATGTFAASRSVPGGYAQRPYDPFVANVKAFSESAPHASTNDSVVIERDELGPRGERPDHFEHPPGEHFVPETHPLHRCENPALPVVGPSIASMQV